MGTSWSRYIYKLFYISFKIQNSTSPAISYHICWTFSDTAWNKQNELLDLDLFADQSITALFPILSLNWTKRLEWYNTIPFAKMNH